MISWKEFWVKSGGVDLAGQYKMEAVFETTRMEKGEFPDLPLKRIFGITTYELV
ncbi:MAG: hypothetical protein KGY41_05205 [Desulfovermiculus sp.]|nr:hypothetical protein [Desulfovermiculus sp.]